jgi:hypothetical protein
MAKLSFTGVRHRFVGIEEQRQTLGKGFKLRTGGPRVEPVADARAGVALPAPVALS